MAALLRSLATKMARAPPPTRRLSAARGLHSGPGRSSSTPNSGSSPPPPPKPEEVLANFMTNWERIKVDFAENAKDDLIAVSFKLASNLVLVGTLYHCWIMPEVNETLSREKSKMKDEIIQTIKQDFEIKSIHIEGERHKAEGQSIQTSGGHDKEHVGHQASA